MDVKRNIPNMSISMTSPLTYIDIVNIRETLMNNHYLLDTQYSSGKIRIFHSLEMLTYLEIISLFLPSGKLTYLWKMAIEIVNVPIINGDVPYFR